MCVERETAALRLLQLLPASSLDPGYACDGAGITDHVWELKELLA